MQVTATRPLRLRPRDGRSRCLVEHVAQHIWRNRLLYWIALVSTVSLALQLTGVKL